MTNFSPGPIVMLGSGETSLTSGRVFEMLAKKYPQPMHISVLETPAGFELNSSQVAGRIAAFLYKRLQNYKPQVTIVAARKRGTPFSPDDPEVLQPLLNTDLIFMGPGSPTYAVRQLKDSLAWNLIRARHRHGAALVFASAATVAVSAWALPVYEIYKVGEDIRSIPGLDLFADFGLLISFIPHWNNTEGGEEVDTSRCFIGLKRYAQWRDMLPNQDTIIGLDEHTALIIDLCAGKCTVDGINSITVSHGRNLRIYPSGTEFSLSEIGKICWPEFLEAGIASSAISMLANASPVGIMDEVPTEVIRLAEERQQARLRLDWAAADKLRKRINEFGWQVQDSRDGPIIIKC